MWVNYQSDFYWWILQLLWSKSRSRFEEIFEEFLRPSHLRDELLMLLGFLSFEGFPVKNIVSMCANVINVFLLHCWSIYVYLQIFKVYANAENSTKTTNINILSKLIGVDMDLPTFLKYFGNTGTCIYIYMLHKFSEHGNLGNVGASVKYV